MDLARPNPMIFRNLAQTTWTNFLPQVKLSFFYKSMVEFEAFLSWITLIKIVSVPSMHENDVQI